ncbi:uncharacterized protein LOC136091857 [Hydra vulgaris]|uniref:Uncharacterized protein LOC136091857 n=1 Tax=Hydra vulgaris TaxID=6087 RepID=A0ABM4DM73_HYDVU
MSTSLIGKRRVRTANINSVKRLIDKVFEGVEDFNSDDNTIDILTSLRDTLIEKFTKYEPLLIPVLMQKIPKELNLIISRKFNDVDCWNIKTVLNVLKTEIQAREESNFNREENPFMAETLYSSGTLGTHNKPTNTLNNNLSCIFCEKDHKSQNSSMCIEKSLPQKNDCQEKGKLSLVAGTLKKYAYSVLLQTAQVTAFSNDKLFYPTRILFESYSQLSYISPGLRTKLNLQTIDVKEIIINSFRNKSEKELLERVRFSVKADSVTGDCPQDIDILVGADFYWNFFDNTTVCSKSGPVALKFKLGGYVLSGFVCDEGDNSCSVNTTRVLKVQAEFVEEDVILKDALNDLWCCSDSCKENDLILQEFQNSTFFDETSGRYVVQFPFHENHPTLPDNYSLCVNRLQSLTGKLSKDEDLYKSYNNIIKDQLSHGIIEKVLNHDLDIGDVHYLPHRPVGRDEKVTTKVRMVFDASLKSFGSSLNDCLHAGPSLTTSLFGSLLRFRSKKFAFLADIEKAFLQIGLVIFFGVTSSPFLLNATLKLHVEKYLNSYPSYVFKQSLHVNDLNSCTDEVNDGINFYSWYKSILKEGGFNLRKFESNSKVLIDVFCESDFTTKPETKVLGVSWDKQKGILIFYFKDLMKMAVDIPKKKEVLKFVASIYDPLGLINPVVVKLKVLFQNLSVSKMS